MIITLSGPAASGKGTLAKMLARELGVPHYDFGLMFRAIAVFAVRFGLEKIPDFIQKDCLRIRNGRVFFRWLDLTERLKTEEVGLLSAKLASQNFLLIASMAKTMVKHKDFICDGRNVDEIYPEAQYKFYVGATREERFGRRLRDLGDSRALQEREELDSMKLTISNKIVIDTTGKTEKESLSELLSFIR